MAIFDILGNAAVLVPIVDITAGLTEETEVIELETGVDTVLELLVLIGWLRTYAVKFANLYGLIVLPTASAGLSEVYGVVPNDTI